MDEGPFPQTNENTVRARLRTWSDRIREREDEVFLVLSLIIGALVGLAVVAFIVVSERLGGRLYPLDGAPWRRLLVPIVGSLGTGYLLFRYFPSARGSGIPQTKAALLAQGGFIPFRTVIGKFLCTSASLASGIPLGREGPSVQVGAGIASLLGRRTGLSRDNIQALIPVGAAAAIAAAFNTPLAAVLFSLEELAGDLHAPILGSVVMSSATSWIVLRLFLGNEPLFHVPQYQLTNPLEFGIYAVLGVLGGLLSFAFVKSLLKTREWLMRLPVWTAKFQPVLGGILVGVLGWYVPQVLGVGYGYVGDALNHNLPLKLMALLILLKGVTVIVSYASGSAGGIFGPSLFLGAMLGGSVGAVAHHFLPSVAADPGAYALVGMGALFAGIIRCPMTSVIMIFETTRDYNIIVPVMIANLVSFFIARRLHPQQIYEALARQEGIHLPSADSHERRSRLRVSNAMHPVAHSLEPQMTVLEAIERVRRGECKALPVMSPEGVIGLANLRQLEEAQSNKQIHTVRDLLTPMRFPHVHADQSLEMALQRMGKAGVDLLPVVSRINSNALEGIIVLQEVLQVYGVGERRKHPR